MSVKKPRSRSKPIAPRPAAPAARKASDSLLARLTRFVAQRFGGTEPKDPSLKALQERLGYTFRNKSLLDEALTHPSYAQQERHRVPHNQRLEFLGDAVLGLILAERLFHDLPGEREGGLARARSALGKGELLATLARKLGLPACLRLAAGDVAAGGREWMSSQEDAFEALVGAVYLDSDYATARDAVLSWFGDLDELRAELLTGDNPKGRLQEWLAQRGQAQAHAYQLRQTSGPDHAKVFHVEVEVRGEVLGAGEGRSKKDAEEQAARAALLTLAQREQATQQAQQ